MSGAGNDESRAATAARVDEIGAATAARVDEIGAASAARVPGIGAASATPATPPAPRAGDDAEASGSDPVIGGTGATHVVVLGWGNASRGDDGLGPLLLARVEALGLAHVTAIEDFQLQLEHALDLDGADLALFLDAGKGTPAPFAFYETAPRTGLTHTSHAMAPEAVLDVYVRVLGRTPPEIGRAHV